MSAMPTMRIMTIRMTVDQADELEFIGRVDGVPVSEVIREAIAAHVEARRGRPAFQQRLRERMEADRHILSRLANEDPS